MNNSIILLVVAPLFAAGTTLFLRRHARWASLAALLLCGGLLSLLFPVVVTGSRLYYGLGDWPALIRISLIMDGLAWICGFTVVLISFAVLLYIFGDSAYSSSFHFFFLMMVASMLGLILTEDIFNMFVFMEILGFCSFVLIAYQKKPQALVASFNYMLLSSLGIAFFLVGVFLVYGTTGTLSLTEAGIRIAAFPETARPVNLAVVCLVAGIGVRLAIMPFHTWLPRAHAYAPHPVSALLSGVMIKVSFVSLWRILELFGSWDRGPLFVWIGAVTAAAGVVLALIQTDVKKLLAFHSVSQMGYIVAAFGAGTSVSLVASCYHLVNHALFKSLLFLCVGTVIAATKERDIRKLGRLGTRLPWVFLPFAAAAFSIAGLPPFNGYISKQLISAGLGGNPAYILIWLTGLGTAASFMKLSGIFRPTKKVLSDTVERPAAPSPGVYPPLFLLGALCLSLGIFPGFWTGLISSLLAPSLPPGVDGLVTPEILSALYSLPPLGGTALMLILASVVFLGITSVRGSRAAGSAARLRLGLRGSLLLFLAGFTALSLHAILLQ